MNMERQRTAAGRIHPGTWLAAGAIGFLGMAAPLQAEHHGHQNEASARQQGQNDDGWRELPSNRQGRSDSGRRYNVDPRGWVRIAYDYDKDGRFDAFEEIYTFDLERARSSSRARRGQGRSGWQSDVSSQRRGSMQQPRKLSGTIENVRTQRLTGVEQPHLLARIKTSSGKSARVDLGPKHKLSELKLSQGQDVTIHGILGRINDRPMVMATRVEAGDRQVEVSRRRSGLRRYRGDVRATRLADFRGFEQKHLLASVELDGGGNAIVDLGPSDQLQSTRLYGADDFSFLARSGRINGRSALIAERVCVNGRSVSIQQRTGQQQRPTGSSQRLQGRPISPDGEPMDEVSDTAKPGAHQKQSKGREVAVVARQTSFQPAEIKAKPGERLRIKLMNKGDHQHNIEFELPSGETQLPDALSAGESGTLTFTAPEKKGEYTFYCPVGNHKEKGMKGRLIVE